MAAVGVAQAARGIVEFREKQCGERAVRGVLAKKLVHGAQQALRLVDSNSALAAQIGLKIGHQQRRGDSLTGNVADDEAEALAA